MNNLRLNSSLRNCDENADRRRYLRYNMIAHAADMHDRCDYQIACHYRLLAGLILPLLVASGGCGRCAGRGAMDGVPVYRTLCSYSLAAIPP